MLTVGVHCLNSDRPWWHLTNTALIGNGEQRHGRRSRGDAGDKSPRIWSRGTLMQIVPLDFCHIDTKRSVLWPSKYAKIRFRPGLCPEPRWGSSWRSPDSLVGWRGNTPHHIYTPTLFGTYPPSVLATRPPQNSSQIYAYEQRRSRYGGPVGKWLSPRTVYYFISDIIRQLVDD